MAITDKETGVWGLDQVYNKLNQGSIISYDGINEFWMWGAAEYGSMGRNESGSSPSTRKRKSSPVQLPGTTWQTEFYNSSSQGWHSILAKTDGTLWAFGKGQDWGQLGQNSKVDYSSPVQIPGTNWKAGGTGREFSFAVRTDGTLWMWGTNNYGQLGQNQAYPGSKARSSPTQIPGSWDNAWGSYESMFAIKTDGTLWAWGRNGAGELGLNQGPGNEQSSPCQIGTATNWVRGSSTNNYGAGGAINTDGELWVWGLNQNGVLGQNSGYPGGNRSSPVQIPGTNWQYFQACGSAGSIGKKTDGTLWVWGGQTITSGATNDATSAGMRSSPVQVPGTNWNRIAGGTGHVVISKTDGTLWTWGGNGSGQLGQNDRTSYSSPIQIPGTSWVNVTVGGEAGTTFATKVV